MSREDGERKAKQARAFMDAIPHSRHLGIVLEYLNDGVAEGSIPYAAHLIGDPATGVIHGGAVSALMDSCAGAAVMSHPAGPSVTATLDLRIDYMRPATPDQAVFCRAECYNMTRAVAFVRVTAYDDDRNRPVATANGAFAVERPAKAKAT